MRRFIVLILIPALLLAGVVYLSRAARDMHYVASANPGEVMFVAAFDGLLDDWRDYDDGQLAATFNEGALRLTVNAVDKLPYSLARPHFGDFDLRVTARAVDGPLNNGFGVIFRAQDQNNYYLFLVSSDGYYTVERTVNGDDKVLSVWIPSEVVNQGFDVANDLRVVARGDQFQFFVNDQPVALCIPDDPNAESTYNDLTGECLGGQMLTTLVDANIPAGPLGVVARSFNETGVVVDFDNVVVSAPAAE